MWGTRESLATNSLSSSSGPMDRCSRVCTQQLQAAILYRPFIVLRHVLVLQLRYANNSNYKHDVMIRKETYVNQAVLQELERIVVDSEVPQASNKIHEAMPGGFSCVLARACSLQQPKEFLRCMQQHLCACYAHGAHLGADCLSNGEARMCTNSAWLL